GAPPLGRGRTAASRSGDDGVVAALPDAGLPSDLGPMGGPGRHDEPSRQGQGDRRPLLPRDSHRSRLSTRRATLDAVGAALAPRMAAVVRLGAVLPEQGGGDTPDSE